MISKGFWWDKALAELLTYSLSKEQISVMAKNAPDDVVHLGRLFGKLVLDGPFKDKFIWKVYDKSVHLIWDLDTNGQATIIAAWKGSINFPWETM